MADAVIHLIARVADGVSRERAATRVAEAHARAHNGSGFAVVAWSGSKQPPPPPPPGGDALWLPPPLVEGNDSEMRDPVCSFGDELQRLVTTASGFSYFTEDAEKPGLVANTSGSVLELALGPTYQAITLSYLRSWRPGMGQAAVSCAGGCTCEAQKLDGRASFQSSVMVQHHFAVSASPNCTLRIEARELPFLPEREAPQGGGGATSNVIAGSYVKIMGVTVTGLQVAPHSGALGGEVRFRAASYAWLSLLGSAYLL